MTTLVCSQQVDSMKKRMIRGQLSMEFIIVMAAYVFFIFILVSALDYSKFLANIEEQEFSLRVKSLQLIETQRLINNRLTDMNIFISNCYLSRTNRTVMCKKENLTKILSIPLNNTDTNIVPIGPYKPIT